MYKSIYTLLLSFITTIPSYSQVLPKEGSKLHYRLIGFLFPEMKGSNNYTIEIIPVNSNTEESFHKKIAIVVNSKNNKLIAEVPSFGTEYTWRVLYKKGNATITTSKLYHFSTGSTSFVDTNNIRLHVVKHATKYKDAFVFLDGTKTLYDMNGRPVWYLPDIGNIGTPPRDMKISPMGTITFLLDKRAYEINYNADILWKGPNDGKISGRQGEGYHHEFTQLSNGHYMILGKKPELWELPSSIDSGVLNAPGEIIVKDSINKKYYQKMELGSVIEYDHAGNVVWSWTPSEYLKSSDLYHRRTIEGLFDLEVHENSFYFDEQEQMLYVSFRDVSRVLKIKYPEGNVVNSYGGKHEQGVREIKNELFCYQHSCKVSYEGNLYLFDNNGCYSKEHPKVVMMSQPSSSKDSLKKVWEYECALQGMNERTGIDSMFTSGGNVIELPDRSLFVSMCTAFGNVFIIGRDKELIWNAISEKRNENEHKWQVVPNYRASIIISRKEMERLIWHDR